MNLQASASVVSCLGWTLIHFLWQGLCIAVWFKLSLRLLGRSPANQRYLFGCVALALMALAPVVTFNHLIQRHTAPEPLSHIALAPGVRPASQVSEPASRLGPVVFVKHESQSGSVLPQIANPLSWLVILWAVGVLAFSARMFAGWLQVQRLKRRSTTPLGEFWESRLAALAQRSGVSRTIRLVQSAMVEVPTVVGWLRPVILLPAGCLIGLSPVQMEAVLAHELAHIRRHDFLINVIQNALEALLFYHPAVWWVSACVRRERENCCDDVALRVCGNRAAYARALATLEELRPGPARFALGVGGAPLLDRIRRLAGRPDKEVGRSGWLAAAIFTMILAAVLSASISGNRARAREQTERIEAAYSTNNSFEVRGYEITGNTLLPENTIDSIVVDAIGKAVTVDKIRGVLRELQMAYGRRGFTTVSVRLPPQPLTNGVVKVTVTEGALSATNVPGNQSFSSNNVAADANRDRRIYPSRSLDPGTNALGPDVNDRLSSNSVLAEWRTTALLSEAERLFEAGDLDGAEAKLKQVPADDPKAPRAALFLQRIKQAREERRAAKTVSQASLAYAYKGRQNILSKLDRIRIDKVEYENWPLEDVVNDIKKRSAVLDPDKTGINVLINRQQEAPPGAGSEVIDFAKEITITIKPGLSDIRLVDALDAITKVAHVPSTVSGTLYYSVDNFGVLFAVCTREPVPMYTRTFHVDTNALQQAMGFKPSEDGVETSEGLSAQVRDFFIGFGLDLNSHTGKAFFYNSRKGILWVHSTAADLDIIEQVLETLNGAASQPGNEGNGTGPVAHVEFSPDGTRIVTASSDGSVRIWDAKTGYPIARNELDGSSRIWDAKTGKLLEPARDSSVSPTNQSPDGKADTQPVDSPAPMLTHSYHLDPNTFKRGLQSAASVPPGAGRSLNSQSYHLVQVVGTTNDSSVVRAEIENVLAANGIDLDPDNPFNAGKSFAYNDRKGTFFVQSTPAEIDRVESIIQNLNTAPPQINIKAVFVEVDDVSNQLAGWSNWVQRGSSGEGLACITNPPISPEQLFFQNSGHPITNSILVQYTGTLSGVQKSAFIHTLEQLEQQEGADILTAPEVTTESGRRAQIQISEVQGIVTGINPNGVGTNRYIVQSMPFGTTLDVIPRLSEDRRHIEMDVIPTITEFLGYGDPRSVEATNINGTVLPLPHFRMRRLMANASVEDGGTIVLGGIAAENSKQLKQKVPVLGDVPLIGRLFSSSSTVKSRKNLLVFITPTIVNPDGTPLHPSETDK